MAWPFVGSLPQLSEVYDEALGFQAQAFPLIHAQGVVAAGASGEMRGTAVALRVGTRITDLITRVTSAASGLTLAKYAIYSSSYSLLASSASVHASFNGATGYVAGALSSVYVVPATGLYYFAMLFVGTTPPTVFRAVTNSSTSTAYGAFPVPHFLQTSLADLPATATPAANANVLWIAAD